MEIVLKKTGWDCYGFATEDNDYRLVRGKRKSVNGRGEKVKR